MSDPRLTAEAQAQNPASPWQPAPVSNGGMTASARDYSGNYSRSTSSNGQIVSAETGKTSRGSTAFVSAPQEASPRVVDYAVDARTQCRIPLSEIDDNSIVYFNGGSFSVPAREARRQGWLHNPSPSAKVEQPSNQPEQYQQQDQQRQQEEHPDLKAEPFADRAVDESLDNLMNNTTGIEQVSAVNEIIRDGEISENTMSRIASQLQQEPGKVQEQLAPIMQAFKTQAEAVMSEGGLNADDVVAYAQQKKPDMLNRAMHKQATQRNTSLYAELRRSYLADLGEYAPEKALAADLGPNATTYRGPKGQVMVRINGNEMTWRSAIMAFGPK